MINEKMSLSQMIEFKPNDEDMAMLDLDVILYLKVSIISNYKSLNYNFIRFLFEHELANEFTHSFKNIMQTTFYDFLYGKDDDQRAITIFELFSTTKLEELTSLFNDMLDDYNHETEVIIDIFTHDNHLYRYSNLDGIIKCEQIN